MAEEEEHTVVHYERNGDVVRFTLKGMSNHELRALMVGIWMRLQREDRQDHIKELEHYMSPTSKPPQLSRMIAEGEGKLS